MVLVYYPFNPRCSNVISNLFDPVVRIFVKEFFKSICDTCSER